MQQFLNKQNSLNLPLVYGLIVLSNFQNFRTNKNRKIFSKLIGNLLTILKTQFYKDKNRFVSLKSLYLLF